jgi:hypothetical protein
MGASIVEVEQAMISALENGIEELKKVGTLGELLASQADDSAILAPSAFVAYTGGKFKTAGMNYTPLDHAMTFDVILVGRSAISQTRLLHGGALKKGVYELLEDIVALFNGNQLSLDIHPLEPAAIDAVAGDRNTAVYTVTFTTRSRS